MVKMTLTQDMIDAGAELLAWLDDTDLTISDFLWLYMPEPEVWKLVIASPKVASVGPRKAYQKIQSVLTRMSEKVRSTLQLAHISVVQENEPIVFLIRKAVRTTHPSARIRFSRNTILGYFIEDALIYRASWSPETADKPSP